MKKTKTNFIKSVLVLGVMMITGLVLVACGGTHLNIEEDIKAQMFAKEAYLIESVYQNQGLDLNSTGSENYVANENYYVKISDQVNKEISKIKLGHVVYEKDEKLETQTSSNTTLTRNVFLVENSELYISNIAMFLNVGNDGVLKIELLDSGYKHILIDVYDEDENQLNLNVVQATNQTLDIADEMNFKYKFSIDNPNGKLFFELEKGEEELDEGTAVLLQTVANPDKDNKTYASRFETPTTMADVEGTGIEVNPGYNQGETYTENTPANHTLIYNVYVPGVGSKTVWVDFINTFEAE